ncbi:hypothetical protein [Psychrobacter faecalis]|uniref:hypothetical protein n=1 Tax=Psychrobacter faecalis TaxID=180588 RepID=UPI003FD33990
MFNIYVATADKLSLDLAQIVIPEFIYSGSFRERRSFRYLITSDVRKLVAVSASA